MNLITLGKSLYIDIITFHYYVICYYNNGKFRRDLACFLCITKKKYSIEMDLNGYQHYNEAIGKLLKVVEQEDGIRISRNGFDQLLWYYYK